MQVNGRFADGTKVEVVWFPHFRSEAEIYSGPEENFYEGGSTRISLGFFCWPRDNQRKLYRFVCGVDGPIDAEWFQPSLVGGGRWHEHDEDAREALLKLRQHDVEMKDYYWKYVEEEEFRHWFVPTTAREACITGISSEP